METKHTKGEWEIAHDEGIGYFITNPNEWGRICTIRSVREPNWEANAKIIAAAPELLEALIMANDVLKATYPLFNEWAESSVIEQAINKATK